MNPDRTMAVENNVQWYSTMAQAHRIAFEQTGAYWCTEEAMPPYYSNYVVADPRGSHLARIEHLLKNGGLQRLTIADSFVSLDESAMKSLGFNGLFEARWYGAAEVRPVSADGLRFRTVETADQLADWEAHWKIWSPTNHPQVFPASLLRVPGVRFRAMLIDGQVLGGALTHESASAVGLSNVFFAGEAASGNLLRCAAATIASHRPVVGYGTAEELDALREVGFDDLGPHRVWIHGT